MTEQKDPNAQQPDKDEAEDLRPMPSQAEGDRETIEEDLEEKKNQK